MNKLTFLIFVLLIVIFGGLFYTFQMGNTTKPQPDTTLSQYNAQQSSPTGTQQQQATATQAPIPTLTEEQKNATITATIKTTKGDITLELYPQEAPNTVANFVNKAKTGFYKNLTFHRVEDWVLQGGDPRGNGTGGGNMKTELNKKPFVVGALGVARGPEITISNDSQFFITKKDSQFLNGQYTNFGMVTTGMDIVNKMAIGDKILDITLQ